GRVRAPRGLTYPTSRPPRAVAGRSRWYALPPAMRPMTPTASIYLDWNATTPPHPDVIAAMRETWEAAWANPASVHGPGRRARVPVERARDAVAALAGAPFDARDVVLTSGGTEANNLALLHPFATPGGGLVVSRIEHPSVVRAAEALADRGVAVAWVAPGPSGRVSPEAVADAIERAAERAEVRLISLQAVNHETGVIQPIAEVAAIARARRLLLHVDAVQAAGRLDPSAWAGADLVTIAAPKIPRPNALRPPGPPP